MLSRVIKKEPVSLLIAHCPPQKVCRYADGWGRQCKALPSDTQPNLLQAWQASLWDAGRDSTGRIDQLNINQRRRREEVKNRVEVGENGKVLIRHVY